MNIYTYIYIYMYIEGIGRIAGDFLRANDAFVWLFSFSNGWFTLNTGSFVYIHPYLPWHQAAMARRLQLSSTVTWLHALMEHIVFDAEHPFC